MTGVFVDILRQIRTEICLYSFNTDGQNFLCADAISTVSTGNNSVSNFPASVASHQIRLFRNLFTRSLPIVQMVSSPAFFNENCFIVLFITNLLRHC